MNSLFFLLLRSVKNTLRELPRKPAKLILVLALILLFVGLSVLSVFTRKTVEQFPDPVWLKGIIFLLILVFLILSVQNGLSTGSSIFDMNDVNLLFVSPVDSRKILIYGIAKMAKTAFWGGFFILFQGNSLGMNFGINLGGLLLILLGFILTVSLLQIVALVIYSLSNGRPRRKMTVRIIASAVFLPLAIYGVIQFMETGNLLSALENTLRSPVFAWTPATGWAVEGTVAFLAGNPARGFFFFGLIIAAGALLILYITRSNPDYYEDVLVAAETAFEKKRAQSEGLLGAPGTSAKKVRLRGTGIGGAGAKAIFHKQIRESFRTNPLGIWSVPSLVMAAVVILAAFLMRNVPGNNGAGILILLQICMWSQIFLIFMGRGIQELYLHYVYLIPESSFRKIIWSNLEALLRVLTESIVMFGVSGLIMKTPPLLVIAVVLSYLFFSFLLLGINLFFLRWTGTSINSGIWILLYCLAVILIITPGIVGGFAVARFILTLAVEGRIPAWTGSASTPAGLGVLALWELGAALGLFALSQGVLHRCDMPAIKHKE